MLKLFAFIAGFILLIGAPQTRASASFDYITQAIPEAKTVGQGRFSWLFWDIYDAALYAPEGKFDARQPFALSLTYLRNLNGAQIADKSAEEMRRLGMKDEVTLATWHAQMRKIFPDVSNGARITGVYNASKQSIFYADGVKIGQINDPNFGAYFFNIWLGDKTRDQNLRAQLLGAK